MLKIKNKLGLLTLIIVSFCCTNCNKNQPKTTTAVEIANTNDALKKEFDDFKNSVAEGNSNVIKGYINFPLQASDIWFKVVDSEKLDTLKNKTFTEKDFEQYHTVLFDTKFKKCLANINTEKLFDTGAYTTAMYSHTENNYKTQSKILATYKDQELTLTLNSVIEDKSIEFNPEHSDIYVFKIINNSLKLVSYSAAG